MRSFPGAFVNFDLSAISAPIERYAPSIEAELRWEGSVERFEMLIDTGSEVSILYPDQGTTLLGEQFERVVSRASTGREYVAGVEGQLNLAIRIPVEMTFQDEDGVPFRFDTTILVAEPSLSDHDGNRGNWDNPPLLGRDLLLHFDLHVSGARGEVFLSLPD